MATVVFVIGPHCSGKTTLLQTLKQELDIVRCSEIGKDLYYERKFMTDLQGEEFEFEVSDLELQRDQTYLGKEQVFGVETWHPGNIAYAAVRNPESVERLINAARQSPFIEEAVGIWLRIPKETIMSRTITFKDNKEWAAEFYHEIDMKFESILHTLGLTSRTHIINADRPLEEIVQEAKNIVQNVTHYPIG